LVPNLVPNRCQIFIAALDHLADRDADVLAVSTMWGCGPPAMRERCLIADARSLARTLLAMMRRGGGFSALSAVSVVGPETEDRYRGAASVMAKFTSC